VSEVVGLVAGSGFASGLSLYATVLLLGVAGRWLEAPGVPDDLTTVPVIAIAGTLAVVEFLADKVPWLDSTWDAIHTIVRPVGAAALGVMLVDAAAVAGATAGATDGEGSGVVAGLAAAVLASVAHGAKASTRVAVNTSPEPFSNPAVSLVEDGLVAVLVWLAVAHPVVAVVVVATLTVLSVLLVVGLWRVLRRFLGGRRDARTTTSP
jgi:hypothetical protein